MQAPNPLLLRFLLTGGVSLAWSGQGERQGMADDWDTHGPAEGVCRLPDAHPGNPAGGAAPGCHGPPVPPSARHRHEQPPGRPCRLRPGARLPLFKLSVSDRRRWGDVMNQETLTEMAVSWAASVFACVKDCVGEAWSLSGVRDAAAASLKPAAASHMREPVSAACSPVASARHGARWRTGPRRWRPGTSLRRRRRCTACLWTTRGRCRTPRRTRPTQTTSTTPPAALGGVLLHPEP